jgi:hypothetical protein
MRMPLRVVGIIMLLLGGLWILQGIGMVGGSFMTGSSFWAITGTIVAIAGAVSLFLSLRGTRRQP